MRFGTGAAIAHANPVFRSLVVVAVFAGLPVLAQAAEIETQSSIDSVTVYPDGATVTRIIKVNLTAGDNTLLARDLPLSLDSSSLRVEGQGGAPLTIGAIDARPPRPQPPANLPEIDKRIEALRDQRGALDGAIAAATARRKFAERFAEASPAGIGDKGEARPLSEWRSAFAAVGEEVAAADGAVREARIKQRDIDRELARLEVERRAKPSRKLELRVDLKAATAAPATLRVTYTVRGARWMPLYDARLDTGARDRKPALELIRRAEIVQATGEDWDNVALSVSTVRTGTGGDAPELRPLVVHYPAPPPPPVSASRPLATLQRDAVMAAAPAARFKSEAAALSFESAREQEAALDTGGYQVVFHVPGRTSIAAQQGAKTVRLATATVAPALIVHAVPSLDQTAFLEADFKNADEAALLPGRVSLYRDGIYVGRTTVTLTPTGDTVRLGFGADDKVRITHTVVRKVTGTAGIIGSSKTDEREFKTGIRNGHDVPIKVAIEDRMPVSEAGDIAVEMLPVTTPPTARDWRDRRGVLQWAFDIAPGEARDIKFGWRVSWPKDKSVVMTPASQ
ncbi:MAG: mucoidy inhibitor MuiA family protein [Rhodopseudomonas sp.]|nr:mucoidy inhibitor MuiA family protein [Rhodopseudomonas sp.]